MNGGIDYSFQDASLRPIFSVQAPVWRGGPFRKGGTVRFDWIPGAHNTFGIGLNFPLAQPYMGKTRPVSDRVKLPRALPSIKSEYVPDQTLQQTLNHIRALSIIKMIPEARFILLYYNFPLRNKKGLV